MKVISRNELHERMQQERCDAVALMKHIESGIPSRTEECLRIDTADIKENIAEIRERLSAHPVLSEITPDGTADNEEDFSDFFRTASKAYMLCLADSIADDSAYLGEVFGVGNDETGYFYAFIANPQFQDTCEIADFNKVGLVATPKILNAVKDKHLRFEGYDFIGACIDDAWEFVRCDDRISLMNCSRFGLVTNLFSRNEGLFETGEMLEKYAVVIGAGSVGSLISLQLARSSVRKFILIDGDVMKIHNVCRHQLGFKDLGRYKVDALKDAILNINPLAEVVVYKGMLQDAPLELFSLEKDGIMIGTADNRSGNALANDLAKHLGIPFVATGCWTRAAAGEVFYWCPDSNLPTYREAYSKLISDKRPDAHSNYFGDEEDRETLNFEPGTCVDIEFVTNIAIKVCLDLLNLNSSRYTTRVLGYLTNSTLICNTNEPAIGGEVVTMFPHPLFISNTIRMTKKDAANDEHRATVDHTEPMDAD